MPTIDVVAIETSLRTSTVIPIRLVDVALLCPDPECGCLIVWEGKRGDGNLGRLIVSSMCQLKSFLYDRVRFFDDGASVNRSGPEVGQACLQASCIPSRPSCS
jgi:hypothetical protein